jgi:RNA polymerase sigma-70 factor (ECF subfamily)
MSNDGVNKPQDFEKTQYERFLQLFRRNEERIFGFILKLLPNFSIAEDIMQDTMMIMWRKFDDFEEGTCFAAWGMQIARYKVMEFHQQNKKHVVVRFNVEVLKQITADDSEGGSKNRYLEALHGCVNKLKEQNRRIVMLRYSKEMSSKQISQQMGVSANVVYKSIAKIHYLLQECVEKTLSAWDLT